jgi:hypothetical protein
MTPDRKPAILDTQEYEKIASPTSGAFFIALAARQQEQFRKTQETWATTKLPIRVRVLLQKTLVSKLGLCAPMNLLRAQS